MWQVSGRVMAVTPQEFVVDTGAGKAVHVDVSQLSTSTRESVRTGDHIKLFGIPQKDNRLVANGFIQEVPGRAGTSR
jgi:ribosomal protein S1